MDIETIKAIGQYIVTPLCIVAGIYFILRS